MSSSRRQQSALCGHKAAPLTPPAADRVGKVDTFSSAEKEKINFAAAVGKVRALKTKPKVMAVKSRPSVFPAPRSKEQDSTPQFFITNITAGDIYCEPPAEYSQGGQGKRDLRRLTGGQYKIVADVDLHGLRQDEAQAVLNEFIAYVRQRGVAARIIYGRGLNSEDGTAKLKIMTRRWLINHPEVIAYAPPARGGDGAVLFLIKRKKV